MTEIADLELLSLHPDTDYSVVVVSVKSPAGIRRFIVATTR